MSCYFWMSDCNIDWPAWVQAVGSIVAIIAAIAIAAWQNHQSDKDRLAIVNARKASQRNVGKIFCVQINESFKSCWLALGIKDLQMLWIQADRLEDILVWSRAFVVDTYTDIELESFVRIRDAAFKLKSLCNSLKNQGQLYGVDLGYIYDGIIPELAVFGVNPIKIR